MHKPDPIARLFRDKSRPPLILAPMAGVTDAPFRSLASRFGADWTVSEMVASQAMIRKVERCFKISQAALGDSPLVVQIAGSDPEIMAKAAQMQVELGAEVIDINMGCPVKKIVGTGAGAALLRDERLAGQIMEKVATAVSVPVTVKIRLGWDDQNRNGQNMTRIAALSGMRAITVHGRTRAQMYSGQADWQAIAEIKNISTIPVIGNGDVTTPEQALHCWRMSGVDGLMIGRAAMGRPWIFREIAGYLEHGHPPQSLTWDERATVIVNHFHAMMAHHGPHRGHLLARKHLGWFTRGFPNGAALRDRINHTAHAEEVLELLQRFFDQQTEAA
ncbi:MAG: tRNA dihydrouridine synthase DusB [Magnetococcales bacterium]|nr:tRNA dihydrouridine synthase DusB [Magnetococcales bacterium]